MSQKAKIQKASVQDSRPANYSFGVKLLSLVAISYAIIAFLNESLFHWQPGQLAPFSFLQIPCCTPGANGTFPFWFSHWTEYFLIVLFGVWRTLAEKNPYTRKRLAVLTASVGLLWWLVPAYLKIPEPFLGNLPQAPAFPSLHTPGTVTFFLVLLLVLFFGRRVICGWCCPCVGIRETIAFPFRINTIRTPGSRKYLRHLKWPFFGLYLVSFGLIIGYSNQVSVVYKAFLALITVPYFLSLLLSPWLGNRAYCRFICPYGATFGLLNRVGFFGIKLDREKCTECGLCEKVCDMGIQVGIQGRDAGRVTTIEECMGCARCVVTCPANALEIRDIRNLLRPSLRQDRNHLLKKAKGAKP